MIIKFCKWLHFDYPLVHLETNKTTTTILRWTVAPLSLKTNNDIEKAIITASAHLPLDDGGQSMKTAISMNIYKRSTDKHFSKANLQNVAQ